MRQQTTEAVSALQSVFGEWRRFQVAALAAVSLVFGGVLLSASQEAPVPAPNVSLAQSPLERRNSEPVFAAFAQVGAEAVLAEPTPLNGLLSMALAQAPALAPPREVEPDLAGLSEIPKELIWNRPERADEPEGRRPSFAAFSEVQAQLPWDEVEPVPFAPLAAAKTSGQTSPKKASAQTTSTIRGVGAELTDWLRTKVSEIKGADRARPLYHFELWLEPPPGLEGQLFGVSYEFSTPAIRPQSQASSDSGTGFRISAAGLACADEIIVTLRFVDGRIERISVDGCELLS